MTDYGILTGIVDEIGLVIGAGSAVVFAVKGRARWEPSEEDVPNGPIKVASIITGIGVGALYAISINEYDYSFFFGTMIFASVALFIGLMAYTILITVYTFDKQVPVSENETRTIKVIGGFWLTQDAKEKLQNNFPTTQKLFHSSAYDMDMIWPRVSRGLTKIAFLIAYFSMIFGGGFGVASTAIILNGAPQG
ncbi:MAG: hypothetical protein RIC29_02760 [Rhodospirillaceae bacterium]